MAQKKPHTHNKKKAHKAAARKTTAASTVTAVASSPSVITATKLPNVWHLSQRALALVWRHKKLFIGIMLIYGFLDLLLVKGFSGNLDLTTIRSNFDQAFSGRVTSGLAVFTLLVGSAASGSSDTAGVYQLVLLVTTSLAIIWGIRQVIAGASIRIRDTYYRGMYPLVPSALVLLVVLLELIPATLGLGIYSTAVNNDIATTGLEQIIFIVIALALTLVSLYMLTSAVFALYIVTLPDMTPLKALRSARDLLRNRRWTVLRKVLFLPLALLVIGALIMLPIIIVVTAIAQWIFFVLALLALPILHTYMYGLYRELLT